MKIAQVSPLVESVPPIFYGGTERVVAYLTEELVEGGHDVTLFASGDSRTSAQLVAVVDQALREQKVADFESYHFLLLEQAIKRADEFDMIHFHIDHLHFPLARLLRFPQVTTLQHCLDLPALRDLYPEYSDMPVISISDNQRIPLNFANWQATIYNGVPEKNTFLGNAFALLFPIKWPEPFDMVIIEAMACGTPTIAFRYGSVPEIISYGETGFIVDNIEQAIESVEAIDTLSRACCRHIFEARFTAKRMMRDYLATYYRLIEQNKRHKLTA